MKIEHHIETLIAHDKIEEALSLLFQTLNESPLLNQVIIQSARYHGIKNLENNTLATAEQIRTDKNNLIASILALKDEIKTELKNDPLIREENSFQRFQVDKKITTVLEMIRMRRQDTDNHLVPLNVLIPLVNEFFERMTFRGEPKIEMCTKQRWEERVHSAHLTYEALLTLGEDFFTQGNTSQKQLFNQLLISISKYVDRMMHGLFEESNIFLEEVDDIVGTEAFVTKFKENKARKFPESDDGMKIIMEDKFKKPINLHLKNTLKLVDELQETVN